MDNKQLEILINCIDEIAEILATRVGQIYPEYAKLMDICKVLSKLRFDMKYPDEVEND